MTSPMPKQICTFIQKHHVLSVSVLHDNEVWAANCFYVFLPDKNGLVIVTDTATKHGMAFIQNNHIAGTISNNQKQIIRIKGVQFQGVVRELQGEELKKAQKLFVNKFPFAKIGAVTLWIIELYKIKMTDNSIIFSHKYLWEK